MYRVPLKSLSCINKIVGKQEELPPSPTPSSFLSGTTPTEPDASIFSFRNRIFPHAMSLIDDDKNDIRDILQINWTYDLLNNLSMTFKDIEDTE